MIGGMITAPLLSLFVIPPLIESCVDGNLGSVRATDPRLA
jgi:Cu/Ag efflux pump CusA